MRFNAFGGFATAAWLVTATATATIASCSATAPSDVAATRQRIAYGSPDTTHSAVVSLLANQMNGFYECSGIIVQVKGDVGYVLTAAHCCNMVAPSVVVMDSDYSTGEVYLGGIPHAPSFAVTPGTIYYDDKYNMADHDFCMLKFSGATGAPTILLPTSGDGLSSNSTVEHVGYGVTDNTTDNTIRRTGTDTLNSITPVAIQWAQAGGSKIPGTCEGDSGGPALFPAGAAQSAQVVVGVTSYGNSKTCSLSTQGVASRVTSETGSTGFITKFLADAPIGTPAPAAVAPSCDACTGSSSVSTCAGALAKCTNDTNCAKLIECLDMCNDDNCASACTTAAGPASNNFLIDFYQCVCESPACATLCDCPGAGYDLIRVPKDLAKAPADLGTSEDDLASPDDNADDLAVDTGQHGNSAGGCNVTSDGSASFAMLLWCGAALAMLRRRDTAR